jgi:hypothetical protein
LRLVRIALPSPCVSWILVFSCATTAEAPHFTYRLCLKTVYHNFTYRLYSKTCSNNFTVRLVLSLELLSGQLKARDCGGSRSNEVEEVLGGYHVKERIRVGFLELPGTLGVAICDHLNS